MSDSERTAKPEIRIKQQERAQRILDAAAELLLRWGYRRVTIEDIARQAEIGTGTVYLHWKTKEAIFESVMLREAVTVWRELLRRITADPQEALVHRIMRSMLLTVKQRPLARAIFTQDSELLGKLAKGETTIQAQQMIGAQDFMQLLRDLGLLRTDSSIPVQAYAFSATISGFVTAKSSLTGDYQVSLDEQADAITQTIQLAFEPTTLPSLEMLEKRVVPTITTMLEQVCIYCEEQIQKRTMA